MKIPSLQKFCPELSVYDRQNCAVLASVDTIGGIPEFRNVMDRWINYPELVIPPVEKAQVVSNEQHSNRHIVQRRLIPKRIDKDLVAEEIVDLDWSDSNATVTFRILGHRPFYYPDVEFFGFEIVRIEEAHKLILFADKPPQDTHILINTLLKKLYAWMHNTFYGYKSPYRFDQLIPKEDYMSVYSRLKSTYAEQWISNWPEKTDARKFVFEDIAIAAFLVCLFDRGTKKPKFVDLGCGNGLLVHLLTCEGYSGYGVDISERKIWNSYGKSTKLVAETLDPPSLCFRHVDYIIGNHADELIPWIPVIASRSRCKFVIIPCCPFSLEGSKLKSDQGQDRTSSTFQRYLSYLQELILECGFNAHRENLRMPSTRNVAFVGETSNLVDLQRFACIEFTPRCLDTNRHE